MDFYASVSLKTTKKEIITREGIHIGEEKIRENIGNSYNNTMNHQVKLKDTKKSVLPISGVFRNDTVFKTTIQKFVVDDFKDIYDTDIYHKKMDFQKKYTEDMCRAKNMVMKKKESGK